MPATRQSFLREAEPTTHRSSRLVLHSPAPSFRSPPGSNRCWRYCGNRRRTYLEKALVCPRRDQLPTKVRTQAGPLTRVPAAQHDDSRALVGYKAVHEMLDVGIGLAPVERAVIFFLRVPVVPVRSGSSSISELLANGSAASPVLLRAVLGILLWSSAVDQLSLDKARPYLKRERTCGRRCAMAAYLLDSRSA